MGTLSTAAREVLIKSVAMAVPSFLMHRFKFPAMLCKEFDFPMAKFWRGQKQNENRIHWKSWDYLGLPRFNGGLGFKNLGDFNTALLGKQAWRLHSEPDAFWVRVIKGIYYPHGPTLTFSMLGRAQEPLRRGVASLRAKL